jgi:hypothetical protein
MMIRLMISATVVRFAYSLAGIARLAGLVLGFAILLSSESRVHGDFLHATAYIEVHEQFADGHTPPINILSSHYGTTFASNSYSDQRATAFAEAQADPVKLVQAYVVGTSSLGSYSTAEDAQAIWRDTVSINGPNPPSFVNLHFHYSADIPPTTPVSNGQDSIYDFSANASSLIDGEAGVDIQIKNGAYNPEESVIGSGIDSLSITPEHIDVSFHLAVPNGTTFNDSLTLEYLPPTKGEAFGIDPLTGQLTSITLPDGNTPESEGYVVTFDSGMASPNISPSAVPEPSTLTLLGIGVAGLAGYGWRRRRQSA